ncbi:MAG: OmpH family outer membrane protein [Caulobacterales bacterium]|nr:OmpH family outer membrane protein [Caulobacterales bacterium]
MTFKAYVAAGCASAIALSGATAAFAQAPAPAAPAISHGAPVPGVCTISIEAAIGSSTVGKYVTTRLQQLVAQVNAELNAEKTGLDNDARALEGQRATLDQNTLEQRAAGLQVRNNALQRKAQLRDREMQVTQEKALGRVGDELEPLIRQAYQQKACSLLINRNAVVGDMFNPAGDITNTVVTALNGKITQFAFDREHLDQQQVPSAAPAAAAPRPATPAPAPKK